MNSIDKKNYYQVVVKGPTNTPNVSQFINVPFKATKLRVVSTHYSNEYNNAEVENLYFVKSDLVQNSIMGVLSLYTNTNNGLVFDINPNGNVSGVFNFNTVDINDASITLVGDWCIILQFEN